MKLKALFEDDGAVSPVIGVILMVAITVILAAVIGTFVLGLGENVDRNAQAGVSFDQSSSQVDVQLTSLGNVESASKIQVDVSGVSCDIGGSNTKSFSSVGEIITVSNCNSGEKITVKAKIDGQYNVIATHEYTG